MFLLALVSTYVCCTRNLIVNDLFILLITHTTCVVVQLFLSVNCNFELVRLINIRSAKYSTQKYLIQVYYSMPGGSISRVYKVKEKVYKMPPKSHK